MSRADFLVALGACLWFVVRSAPDRLWHRFAHIYGPWHDYPTVSIAHNLEGASTEEPINYRWRKCRVCGWVDHRTVYSGIFYRKDQNGKTLRLSDHQGRDPWSDDYGKP